MSTQTTAPVHEVHVDSYWGGKFHSAYKAFCSCGWSGPDRGVYQADANADAVGHHMAQRPNRYAGHFEASCRLGEWLPLDKATNEQRAHAEQMAGGNWFRWDKELGAELVRVECAFHTADRAEFEAHMADVHGRKMKGPRQLTKPRIRKGPPVAGPAEGREFKPSSKALAQTVDTCPRCGLVAEIRGGGLPGFIRPGAELWWREHVERCAGIQTEAVAS